jgi:hypothetical protein
MMNPRHSSTPHSVNRAPRPLPRSQRGLVELSLLLSKPEPVRPALNRAHHRGIVR